MTKIYEYYLNVALKIIIMFADSPPTLTPHLKIAWPHLSLSDRKLIIYELVESDEPFT